MSQSYNYIPIPPRVWSRVQSQCTYTDPSSNYATAYVPIINETLPLFQAISYEQNLYKGNILQYKANSSRITKKQRYAQISKGLWCNRTKVFATQSQTYTNPNTTSLQRVNYSTLPYPNQIVGKPNNISGPFQYNVPSPYGCPTTTVQDGGNLVCGTYINPCTNEVIQTTPPAPLCFPSYCSDVPGIPVSLCWNPKAQTFFPRNNLTMSNSLNKWPEGYKGLVSAVTPASPVLLTAEGGCEEVVLSWTYTFNACIPISNFYIYQNGRKILTVPYTTTTTTIYNLISNTTYSFYITSVSSTIESLPSNTLSATTLPIYPPINLTGTFQIISPTLIDITLNWLFDSECVTSFNIYQNGIVIQTLPYNTTSITLNNLSQCNTYNFYVTTVSNAEESVPSNTFTVSAISSNLVLNGSYNNGVITLNWNFTQGQCGLISYNIYQNSTLYQQLSANITSTTISIPYNNSSTAITYTYYVEAVQNSGNTLSNTYSYTLGALYSATNYTAYNNNGYSAIVFTDTSSSSTFTFNANISSCNFIVIGGGGGGGLQNGNTTQPYTALDPYNGGGGAGGGVYLAGPNVYSSNTFSIFSSITGTITIGAGGSGASATLSSNNGNPGGPTNVSYSGNTYTATGGLGSIGSNGTYSFNTPYQPYGSGYVIINGTPYYNYYGGWGGCSNSSITGYSNYTNGGAYWNQNSGYPIEITLQFTAQQNIITPSGGGGGATVNSSTTPVINNQNQSPVTQYSGNAGGAYGGFGNGNYYYNFSGQNGENAILPNNYSSFGGGGGGGVGTIEGGTTTNYVGGNGGSGVVIIYWQNLTF